MMKSCQTLFTIGSFMNSFPSCVPLWLTLMRPLPEVYLDQSLKLNMSWFGSTILLKMSDQLFSKSSLSLYENLQSYLNDFWKVNPSTSLLSSLLSMIRPLTPTHCWWTSFLEEGHLIQSDLCQVKYQTLVCQNLEVVKSQLGSIERDWSSCFHSTSFFPSLLNE